MIITPKKVYHMNQKNDNIPIDSSEFEKVLRNLRPKQPPCQPKTRTSHRPGASMETKKQEHKKAFATQNETKMNEHPGWPLTLALQTPALKGWIFLIEQIAVETD